MIALYRRSPARLALGLATQLATSVCVVLALFYGNAFADNVVTFAAGAFLALSFLSVVAVGHMASSTTVYRFMRGHALPRWVERLTTPVELVLFAGYGRFWLTAMWALTWLFSEIFHGILAEKGNEECPACA